MNYSMEIKSCLNVLVSIVSLFGFSQHDYTEPDVSLDGKYLVFCSNKKSENAIFTSNSDGSEIRLLIDLEGYESAPNWSPNGEKICFYSMDKNGDSKLYVINKDGSGLIEIGNNKLENPETPTWLSDHQIILSAGTFPKKNIYQIDISTEEITRITDSEGINYYPDIRNGKLVFCKFSKSIKGIFLLDLVTKETIQLAEIGEAPIFNQEGSVIIYQGKVNADKVTGLRIINLNTKENKALTSNSDLSELPDLDEQRNHVYYQRKMNDHFSIWRISIESKQNIKIIGN